MQAATHKRRQAVAWPRQAPSGAAAAVVTRLVASARGVCIPERVWVGLRSNERMRTTPMDVPARCSWPFGQHAQRGGRHELERRACSPSGSTELDEAMRGASGSECTRCLAGRPTSTSGAAGRCRPHMHCTVPSPSFCPVLQLKVCNCEQAAVQHLSMMGRAVGSDCCQATLSTEGRRCYRPLVKSGVGSAASIAALHQPCRRDQGGSTAQMEGAAGRRKAVTGTCMSL